MNTTKLYRMEHPSNILVVGEGVYTSLRFKDVRNIQVAHRNSIKHPSIRTDIYDWEWNDFFDSRYCACPSLKLLKVWFRGWVSRLKADGFIVVEYEVKSYLPSISGRQAMFHPKDIISKTILN